MIIFVEDTQIDGLRSLFNGETSSFSLNNKPNIVFNLSSLYNMGIRVDLTPPATQVEEREFDIMYANWILGNDTMFVNFFQFMYYNYLGYNVFILVGVDMWEARQTITESLMKLIQQRYQIIPRYIATMEDIPDYYEEDFMYVDGMMNMDSDIERYIYLRSSIDDLEELMKAPVGYEQQII